MVTNLVAETLQVNTTLASSMVANLVATWWLLGAYLPLSQ
tara:strand:+ start:1706 stop:1825 length:120 start_codon:yes stop_codon:yes gene_type:complete